jgi:hypothetical protein
MEKGQRGADLVRSREHDPQPDEGRGGKDKEFIRQFDV